MLQWQLQHHRVLMKYQTTVTSTGAETVLTVCPPKKNDSIGHSEQLPKMTAIYAQVTKSTKGGGQRG